MANDYFNASGYPATRAAGVSSSLRAELSNIALAFDKLLPLAGNAGKLPQVNPSGNGFVVATAINALPVGTTTPAAGAFTTLSSSAAATLASANVTAGLTVGTTLGVTGATTLAALTASGVVSLTVGAVGAPGLTFTGDTDTGMWAPGANTIAFSTNGVERLRADTAALATTLPLSLPLGAVATPSYTFTGDLNTGMWSPAADTLAWSVGGAELARIDGNGVGVGDAPSPNVRINAKTAGTGTTAGANLAVRLATSAASRDVSINFTDGVVWNSYIGAVGAGDIYFGASGGQSYVERMRITAAGVIQDGAGIELGYKGLPVNLVNGGYTLVTSDKGKQVLQVGAANITLNAAGMPSDFTTVIVNASGGAITLVQGAGVTLRLGGSGAAGSRLLASWAICSVITTGGGGFMASGPGVS